MPPKKGAKKSAKKAVTVEEASPSPPPLPSEPAPAVVEEGDADAPVDVPIASLGGDDEDDVAAENDEEDEWDPSEERRPGEPATKKQKGKGKAVEAEIEEPHPWQAVWSAEKNAWYFWNTKSGEVTWTNPLPAPAATESAPPLPAGPAPSSSAQPQAPLPAQRRFGVVPEIDPALAFLLPPEARGGVSDPTAQSAMFNARTGRFTANDYMYNVEHLDEYNRMKRMNNQYFDQDAWERDMAEHNAKKKRDAEAGVAPKPLSKKDMERFRKMKQEKRLRGQAWLRD
ncbi:uncharacterized protein MKK02DRAFT_32260 [Dioszegia hungarica]|uniref:WW domain-containing protein n=1 Tax=Dioszegia hungarica TaxID=4972 RepID=A0AA38HAN4_9TREE|nr:uncharacterized protein MKK02DRAFT_32260 [Dioszegia hungarica]KAI9637403.1 hypothetical protein MKK02DRAFT_32260 [Dioszegia hungarica]